MAHYILLIVAVFLISSVQIVVKLRLSNVHGHLPASPTHIPAFFMEMLRDPWLWGALSAMLIAAYLWYFSISRLSLGVAFTFSALSYPMVMLGSYLFLGEQFTTLQCIGCGVIIIGVFMMIS